ncbi:uncharacterized protein LOC111391085 [Olea europaea subsp. europaea]|uniref:Uncharacterized protein LOC111391085 n=1 Tax=Olea europaea subsp. europaea TaxID=158383 RepID=A0A8S0VKV4_OLEEU|nr:uncharacterized protein LOC111391085 [Olea europaea subsp. europaea]
MAGCYSCTECRFACNADNKNAIQNKLESPMPWIGMYITTASVVCSLAMAADAVRGFHSKMLWFPCKYFSINAMSLTLLAVTLKLPIDLTANMLGIHEKIALDRSLMSTAMANFITSLGSMDDNEMALNISALEIVATIFIFLSLVILCSSALIVLTTLDENGNLAIIRNAADAVWLGVDLNCNWQEKDLRKTSLHGRTSNEILEELSNEAERTVKQFLEEVNDFLMDNPLNWPVKIIAANSMYRISRTILLASGNKETDVGLFDHLSVMIVDILAASLTNIPHVITTKCHHNSQKERQNSVRQAALLLGETEEILQILQLREIPSLDPDNAAYIDEWRIFIEEHNGNSLASISSIGSETQQFNEEHVAVELHD